MDRRNFVKIAGVTAAVGAAGCLNGDENGDDDEDENGEEELDFVDETGQDEVTVDNGAGPQGLQFDPNLVEVSAGTTVTWVWTGEGGQHNVVHDPDGGQDDTGAAESMFESELTGEEGHEFSYTFDEAGTYYYICEPHLASGMEGHVRVVENGVGNGEEEMNGEEDSANEAESENVEE